MERRIVTWGITKGLIWIFQFLGHVFYSTEFSMRQSLISRLMFKPWFINYNSETEIWRFFLKFGSQTFLTIPPVLKNCNMSQMSLFGTTEKKWVRTFFSIGLFENKAPCVFNVPWCCTDTQKKAKKKQTTNKHVLSTRYGRDFGWSGWKYFCLFFLTFWIYDDRKSLRHAYPTSEN